MTYWIPWPTKEGLHVSANKKRDYANQRMDADTTNKNGEVDGNLNNDFPYFSGAKEEVFSRRLANEILKLNPEGIIIRPITLKLTDGSLNNNFCEMTISAHVDCIDFKRSELDMDEKNGLIDFVDKLVLNKEKADRAGYDIFRLHSRFTSIVISDRVKQVIESVNPIGIRFEPTDGSDIDWY